MRCPGAAEQARVVSWKVELDEAEQAQGEVALTLEMLDEVLRDHINDEYDRSTALAKRVKALMEMVADQAEALRLHTHLTKDGSATYSPASPPPEAAGPGHAVIVHAFVVPTVPPGPGEYLRCMKQDCGKRANDPVHAVPPITSVKP
jgi:hypothetical protein